MTDIEVVAHSYWCNSRVIQLARRNGLSLDHYRDSVDMLRHLANPAHNLGKVQTLSERTLKAAVFAAIDKIAAGPENAA